MSKSTKSTTTPTASRPTLRLVHYGGRPIWPERPTLGLKAFECPRCGHDEQRLMRAHQHWQDESDRFCAQIHVEMDFFCRGCEKAWRLHIFNEDEGEGHILMEVSLVQSIYEKDAERVDTSHAHKPTPGSNVAHYPGIERVQSW
jgi:hypothetical protein